MDLSVDYLVINGVRYIPEEKTILVNRDTEPVLVYQNNREKKRQQNRDYYKRNAHKWKEYYQNKRGKQVDLRIVIEFY